jgi:hypothetical protein
VAAAESSCNACGEPVSFGDKFCKSCGQAIIWTPATAASTATKAQEAGPTLQLCPGCKSHSGPPGALCPHCGSKLPDPKSREDAIGLGILGAAVFGVGLLLTLISGDVGGIVAGIGLLGIFGAVALLVGGSGRVGPEKQSSCCGCSCVIALILLPATALALSIGAGSSVVMLATLPVWMGTCWVVHGLSIACRRSLSRIDRMRLRVRYGNS